MDCMKEWEIQNLGAKPKKFSVLKKILNSKKKLHSIYHLSFFKFQCENSYSFQCVACVQDSQSASQLSRRLRRSGRFFWLTALNQRCNSITKCLSTHSCRESQSSIALIVLVSSILAQNQCWWCHGKMLLWRKKIYLALKQNCKSLPQNWCVFSFEENK